MKRWFMLTIGVLFFALAGVARAQEAPVDSLALARKYTLWLYVGEVDSLIAHSSDRTKESEAREGSYARVSGMIAERAGFELSTLDETWKLRNGRCQYWRAARFSKMPDGILVRWVLAPDGRIDGFGAGPLSEPPPVEAETCAPR
jgi:hypothetical protein